MSTETPTLEQRKTTCHWRFQAVDYVLEEQIEYPTQTLAEAKLLAEHRFNQTKNKVGVYDRMSGRSYEFISVIGWSRTLDKESAK
jgi:ABC-type histidine transport system ATPase subunit